MNLAREGVTLEPLYYVGVDLGTRHDHTAISVLEQQVWLSERLVESHPWPGLAPGWSAPDRLYAAGERYPLEEALERDDSQWPGKPPMLVRHLERIRHTPYPAIVTRVATIITALPPLGVVLVVDGTGVGVAIIDLLRQAGLRPVSIVITGGDAANRTHGEWRVPKRDLVASVQSGLQTDRLKIAAGLPLADVLVAELDAFKVTIDARTRHDSYGNGRERDHDDCVLAVALPLWLRDKVWRGYDADRMTRTPAATDSYAANQGAGRMSRPAW